VWNKLKNLLMSKRAKGRAILNSQTFRDTEWYDKRHTLLWTDPRGASGGITHVSWSTMSDEALSEVIAKDGHAHLGLGRAHTHLARLDNAPEIAYPSILAHEALHAALLDLAKRAGSSPREIFGTLDRDLLLAHRLIDGEFWSRVETAGVAAVSRPVAWAEYGYLGRLDNPCMNDDDLAYESGWEIDLGHDSSDETSHRDHLPT
jgi:hypothetical protein